MKHRRDGSVQSGNIPTIDNTFKRNNDTLYRCMVSVVRFVGDPDNITNNSRNPEVLYDCIIMGGPEAGQVISNCRLGSDLGGNGNYFERVLKASTETFGETPLEQHDGDVVYVAFNQGHSGYPAIIATSGGTQTAGLIGATAEDGPRSRRQYNGVFEEIGKDGSYIWIQHGGEFNSDSGCFESTGESLYSRELSREQVLTEMFLGGLSEVSDGMNDTHTRTFAGGLTESTDGMNDIKTISLAGGLEIVYDGQSDLASITTSAGATVEIDGQGNTISITAGSTEIILDGNGGLIDLRGSMVNVGQAISDFAVLFTQLLTAFNTHTHPFMDQTAGGPVPNITMPPTAPMLQTVGSLTVGLQA